MRNTGSRTRPPHTRVGRRTPRQRAAQRKLKNEAYNAAIKKSRAEMSKGWKDYGPKVWRRGSWKRRMAMMAKENKEATHSVKRKQGDKDKGGPPKYWYGIGLLLVGAFVANKQEMNFQSISSMIAAAGQRVTGAY